MGSNRKDSSEKDWKYRDVVNLSCPRSHWMDQMLTLIFAEIYAIVLVVLIYSVVSKVNTFSLIERKFVLPLCKQHYQSDQELGSAIL